MDLEVDHEHLEDDAWRASAGVTDHGIVGTAAAPDRFRGGPLMTTSLL
jgi:hypothetical protein